MNNADLESVWRERVRQAREKYAQESAAAAQIQSEYSSEQLLSSDGAYALQRALRAEHDARQEYMRVLQIFTRLLDGQLPNE